MRNSTESSIRITPSSVLHYNFYTASIILIDRTYRRLSVRGSRTTGGRRCHGCPARNPSCCPIRLRRQSHQRASQERPVSILVLAGHPRKAALNLRGQDLFQLLTLFWHRYI